MALIYGTCVVSENAQFGRGRQLTKLAVTKSNEKRVLSNIPRQHVILAGSRVKYTLSNINEGCFALVLNTGFETDKGRIIRNSVTKIDNYQNIYFDRKILYMSLCFVALITGMIYVFFERVIIRHHQLHVN